jgi:hypothetical protein
MGMKPMTSGYINLDGTHMMFPGDWKNIIIFKETRTIPYIESIPNSNVDLFLGSSTTITSKLV